MAYASNEIWNMEYEHESMKKAAQAKMTSTWEYANTNNYPLGIGEEGRYEIGNMEHDHFEI